MHLLLDNLDISFVMSRVRVLKFVSCKATCMIEKTKMIEIIKLSLLRFYFINLTMHKVLRYLRFK